MAINLTDAELEELVEKVTEKVIQNFYQSVGETVTTKIMKLVGLAAVSFLLWMMGSGHFSIKQVCMPDGFGFSDGIKSVSQSLNATRDASKELSKSIEGIQKDGIDVAQQRARERRTALREAEFKKERALIRALEEWKRKKHISDEEAQLKIDFVKKYGAKEWDAVLRIKLDIENMERKANEEFQHDLKEIRRVQMWCFFAAFIVYLWLKFVLGII